MTTIPTYRPTSAHHGETDTAIDALAQTVTGLLTGELDANGRSLARPLPIAFLDDGRRLFLVVDLGTAGASIERPRSWGVEIGRDNDLVGTVDDGRVAVRSTRRLTPEAAAQAARYVLAASA